VSLGPHFIEKSSHPYEADSRANKCMLNDLEHRDVFSISTKLTALLTSEYFPSVIVFL
jgi:hypothetical protein